MIKTSKNGNLRGFSKPRSIVLLNGNAMNFNNWTVNLNSTQQASDFSINFPFKIGNNLNQGYLVGSPDFASYLFTNPNIKVEVYSGYPKNPDHYTIDDLTRIMNGYMDQAELDLDNNGEIITISGRDLTAPFLDNQTTIKYQNMTSSAIAIMLAKKRGLKYSVQSTYTLTGKYYNADHSRMTTQMAEWDMLTFLADQEGFAVLVIDDTLYFKPFEQIVGIVSNDPMKYAWGQNVLNMTLTKSPHASKDIIVDVHSYDKTLKRHVTATAKKTFSSSGGTTYHEVYYYSGLTLSQCQKIAKSKLSVLSQLEVTGTMTVSGDPNLVVNRQIDISGTGKYLDGNYYIRQATHNFDMAVGQNSGGYQCDLQFSNLLMADQQTDSGV